MFHTSPSFSHSSNASTTKTSGEAYRTIRTYWMHSKGGKEWLYTSSKRQIPAQGKPARIGSAFIAISSTDLNLSKHGMTLSASSRSLTVHPKTVNAHLLSSHVFCFSWAALSAPSSADSMSSVLNGVFCSYYRSFPLVKKSKGFV